MAAAMASGIPTGAQVLPPVDEDAIFAQELGDRYLARAISDEAGNELSHAVNWAEQQGGDQRENVELPIAEPFLNCMCQLPVIQITGNPPAVSCQHCSLRPRAT